MIPGWFPGAGAVSDGLNPDVSLEQFSLLSSELSVCLVNHIGQPDEDCIFNRSLSRLLISVARYSYSPPHSDIGSEVIGH